LQAKDKLSANRVFLSRYRVIRRSITVIISLALLSACQTVPFIHSKDDHSSALNHEFSLIKNQSVFGQVAEIEVNENDSLPLIARHYGLGYDEITLANPSIDPWLPQSGDTVRLPLKFILPSSQKRGLVLNLAAKRLFYFPENNANKVLTFPIGIGRDGWKTPTGTTSVIAKKHHPDWVVPRSIRLEHKKKGDPLPRVVPAGPNNPLGDYAIRLGIPSYLIHGTNKPYGVGMAISHGCVRLYPEDIALLFKQIKLRSRVKLIHQPLLIGWEKNELYVQVYPSTDISKKHYRKLQKKFNKKLKLIEHSSTRQINWDKVDEVLTQKNGISTAIFIDSHPAEASLFNQPLHLYQQIKPKALTDNSWRLKVAEFPDMETAKRLAVMLNHQGPPIPSHSLANTTGHIVIAGPFVTEKEAHITATRLNIDFAIVTSLIEPGQKVLENHTIKSFFSNLF